MTNLSIVGIALSEDDAAHRPKKTLKTDILSITTRTAGKIFIGITSDIDRLPFALQMTFDGVPVEIKDNEKGMNSTLVLSPQRKYESYAVDLPMRMVTVQEQPHIIRFKIGKYVQEKFVEEGESPIFELYTPSEGHQIDPKVNPADQD